MKKIFLMAAFLSTASAMAMNYQNIVVRAMGNHNILEIRNTIPAARAEDCNAAASKMRTVIMAMRNYNALLAIVMGNQKAATVIAIDPSSSIGTFGLKSDIYTRDEREVQRIANEVANKFPEFTTHQAGEMRAIMDEYAWQINAIEAHLNWIEGGAHSDKFAPEPAETTVELEKLQRTVPEFCQVLKLMILSCIEDSTVLGRTASDG
jgi:hypothetical protein